MSKQEDSHKKPILIISGILTFLILLVGVIMLSGKGDQNKTVLPQPDTYEYYWSQTCPHCVIVNEFMNTWESKDKIKLDKYDVNETEKNILRFLDRGKYCNYPREELGVPFLVTPDGLCLAGDEAIINHLKSLDIKK